MIWHALMLAALGVAESIAYARRIRSASGTSAIAAANHAATIVALRLAWLYIGVSAVIEGMAWPLAAAAYVAPVWAATAIEHARQARPARS